MQHGSKLILCIAGIRPGLALIPLSGLADWQHGGWLGCVLGLSVIGNGFVISLHLL
jgi:hypothetical protein